MAAHLQLRNRPFTSSRCSAKCRPSIVAMHGAPHPRPSPQHTSANSAPQPAPTRQCQASKIAAACAAALLLTAGSPTAAMADIQTVTPTQLTQMAKPLPKQSADKGKIWTLFLGGAAALFVGTIAAENNENWFPAISRANKAMAMNREAQQKAQEAAARKQK